MCVRVRQEEWGLSRGCNGWIDGEDASLGEGGGWSNWDT